MKEQHSFSHQNDVLELETLNPKNILTGSTLVESRIVSRMLAVRSGGYSSWNVALATFLKYGRLIKLKPTTSHHPLVWWLLFWTLTLIWALQVSFWILKQLWKWLDLDKTLMLWLYLAENPSTYLGSVVKSMVLHPNHNNSKFSSLESIRWENKTVNWCIPLLEFFRRFQTWWSSGLHHTHDSMQCTLYTVNYYCCYVVSTATVHIWLICWYE